MNNCPIFVINLDGSQARLAAISAALSAQGAAFKRLSAYDGRKTDPHTVPEYSSHATRSYMGRDLNGGEVGCYMSHVAAARAVLETDAPFALVLEDDAAPTSDAIALVQALLRTQTQPETPGWHLCHLGGQTIKYFSETDGFSLIGDGRRLVRAHYFPMTTTALLWSRQGAQAFLDIALPIRAPVDNALRRWLTATDMGVAVTPPVFKPTNAASEIDTAARLRKTGGREKLYHWIKAKRVVGEKLRAILHKARFAGKSKSRP